MQRQVEAEIREFARFAEARIIAEQAEAVRAAQEHAEQLTLAGLGEPPPGVTVTFARLPSDAVTDLVGFLQDGSPPARALLDERGPEASKAVRDALVAGVATGQHPRVIARQIRQALGGNLVRALTISRTEILRSYRESSRRSYQANSDVVKGWVWHSALGTRTCPACWAMHGTFHRLDERLDDHPRGRCAMVPVTKTWEELGFKGIPEARRQIETGVDLFEKLPDADKEKILGKAAFQAYKAGTVKLEDFVGRKRSREWGTMRYTRSLRDILGPQWARKWMEKALNQPLRTEGAQESVKQRIERLIAEGKKSGEDVANAIQFWQQQLQSDIRLPSGDAAQITLDDLYHLMVDDRILRKPERILQVAQGVFEIRQAKGERRRILSSWVEGEQSLYGFAIIEPDGRIRTMHVVGYNDLRKYRKETLLWSRSEQE